MTSTSLHGLSIEHWAMCNERVDQWGQRVLEGRSAARWAMDFDWVCGAVMTDCNVERGRVIFVMNCKEFCDQMGACVTTAFEYCETRKTNVKRISSASELWQTLLPGQCILGLWWPEWGGLSVEICRRDGTTLTSCVILMHIPPRRHVSLAVRDTVHVSNAHLALCSSSLSCMHCRFLNFIDLVEEAPLVVC